MPKLTDDIKAIIKNSNPDALTGENRMLAWFEELVKEVEALKNRVTSLEGPPKT